MFSNYVYDTHRLMSDKNINLAFSGHFTPELITSMLAMTKSSVSKSATLKKVYNIIIECLENLTKHGAPSEEQKKEYPSIFIFGNDDDYYYVSTGNTIKDEEVAPLKEKLEKVNSLDRSGLRAWYNDVILNGEGVSEKGGAGLGIIDVAMKSGSPLEFEFKPLRPGYKFYVLKVKVEIKKKK